MCSCAQGGRLASDGKSCYSETVLLSFFFVALKFFALNASDDFLRFVLYYCIVLLFMFLIVNILQSKNTWKYQVNIFGNLFILSNYVVLHYLLSSK